MKKVCILTHLLIIFYVTPLFADILGTWELYSVRENSCNTLCPGTVSCGSNFFLECDTQTYQFNSDNTGIRFGTDGVSSVSEPFTYSVVNDVLSISAGEHSSTISLFFYGDTMTITIIEEDGVAETEDSGATFKRILNNLCTNNISPSTGHFTANGGASLVSVATSSPNCTWTTYESLSWVSLSTTGGTDNGTVTINVSANSGTARSGSVTIAGKTYTISQSAAPCTYNILPSSGSFTADGGTGSVSVTASSTSCAWTASESLSWVSLSTAGGTGNGTVTVNVTANTGVAARFGSVLIAGKSYIINQAATAAIPVPPTLISPASNANAPGASVNLSWSASIGATQYWLWARRTSDNAIIINQNIGNKTSYNLTGLSSNSGDYYWMVRAGNSSGWSAWTVARRFFNGAAAAIPVPPTLISPASNANAPGTSVNLSWTASSGATQYWLWARRTSDNVVIFNQSVGNKTSYTLTGLPNNGSDYYWMVRAGNSSGWSAWTVARRFFNGSAPCTYSVYGGSVYISGAQGYSPAQYGYTFLGTGSSTNTFNGSYSYYIITTSPPNVAYVDTVKGSNNLYYPTWTTGNSTDWEKVGGAPDGIPCVVGGLYNGQAGGYILISPEVSPLLSSITVCISNSQAPSCTYSLSSSSGSFTASGGTSSVSVMTSSTSCAWTASESLAWVSLSPTSGTGSKAVTITASANTGAARTGSVTIAGKTYTISQAATGTTTIPVPPVLISPASNANAPGTSVNLSWGASSGATQYWLWARRTIDNVVIFNQNVGNNTSYNLTDLPNNGKDYFWMVRAGNTGGWSTWTPARRFFNGTASCTYSLSSSSGSFTPSGGTSTVLVTASSSSCSWTASESLSWVSLSPPISGTGSGTITITVSANTGAARSGSVSIAGQTYTINQAAVSAEVNPGDNGLGVVSFSGDLVGTYHFSRYQSYPPITEAGIGVCYEGPDFNYAPGFTIRTTSYIPGVYSFSKGNSYPKSNNDDSNVIYYSEGGEKHAIWYVQTSGFVTITRFDSERVEGFFEGNFDGFLVTEIGWLGEKTNNFSAKGSFSVPNHE